MSGRERGALRRGSLVATTSSWQQSPQQQQQQQQSDDADREVAMYSQQQANNGQASQPYQSRGADESLEGTLTSIPFRPPSNVPALSHAFADLSASRNQGGGPDDTRLDHIFDMISLLDGGDGSIFRMVEEEILRAERQGRDSVDPEHEREVDDHLMREMLMMSPRSTSSRLPRPRSADPSAHDRAAVASAHDELDALLGVLARANERDSFQRQRSRSSDFRPNMHGDIRSLDSDSRLRPQERDLSHDPSRIEDSRDDVNGLDRGRDNNERADNGVGVDHDIEDEEDDDEELQHDEDLDIELTELHIQVIHLSLTSAMRANGLLGDDEQYGQTPLTPRRSRSRGPRPLTPLPDSVNDNRDEEEHDRERHREHDDEQIEGYEGAPTPAQERNSRSRQHRFSDSHVMPRATLADVMEMLRELSIHGIGAEEVDDHVLQAVLQLNQGPSSDANGNDHSMGDEQLQLYQEGIRIIDDFLELLSIQSDNGGLGMDDDDDVDDDDALDSDVFVR